MSEFVGIREARGMGGLRLLLLRGVPSPWSQAAKGLFEVKGIPFAKVCLEPGEPRELLQEWTGQDSFPAALYDDERPRTGWAEILLLAERLAPSPSLVPADPGERALLFGLAHEICGEMGLGWCRRLMLMAGNPALSEIQQKYGSSHEEAKAALGRVAEVLRLLAGQLSAQRAAGRRFLVGDALSAADVYWATFCNLVAPLPPEQLPLPDALRPMFQAREPEILDALDPALLAHRDFVYESYLTLPVEL